MKKKNKFNVFLVISFLTISSVGAILLGAGMANDLGVNELISGNGGNLFTTFSKSQVFFQTVGINFLKTFVQNYQMALIGFSFFMISAAILVFGILFNLYTALKNKSNKK